MEWYYVRDGNQKGPLSSEQLRAVVSRGEIGDEDLVWHAGLDQWQPLAEVRDQLRTDAGASAGDGMGGLAAGVAGDSAGETVVCGECGRMFRRDQVIELGGMPVCAACKPTVLQKIQEGVSSAGGLRYGGFWIRFGAKFIDGVVMWIVNIVPTMLIQVGMGAALGVQENPGVAIALALVSMLVQFVIKASYVTFFLGRYGATPGKMACGLKVVRSDGSRITYLRALGRYCAEMLSGVILGIGYLMAAFDEEKRTLHDHMCDTRVVYK